MKMCLFFRKQYYQFSSTSILIKKVEEIDPNRIIQTKINRFVIDLIDFKRKIFKTFVNAF